MTPFVRTTLVSLSVLGIASATPSLAALKVGDKAPDFKVAAATDGQVADFSLKTALKNGPVVVYFYPKAFTGGCSLEARQFSQAIPQFQSKHVTVIGLSADGIDVLKDFSKKDCAGKFPVGSDSNIAVTKAYDAQMGIMNMSSRISYVVSKDGRIAFVHDSGDASTHVPALLKAVGAGK
ncbi:peroxiredoxin [Asticcacaulis sp. AC402]|uniref:peroxiredoxin n=1 Tax=Asticcacaulis sp. AC402 TaxID=1282361 RepID=UPI0003C3FEE4|nr:redoxin domain-containing protein [Asticcacaulis sp. AC402]ESQ73862.1 alkyl hydroperoxide reductase [Asticcacaulis sp. AC402]